MVLTALTIELAEIETCRQRLGLGPWLRPWTGLQYHQYFRLEYTGISQKTIPLGCTLRIREYSLSDSADSSVKKYCPVTLLYTAVYIAHSRIPLEAWLACCVVPLRMSRSPLMRHLGYYYGHGVWLDQRTILDRKPHFFTKIFLQA